MINTGKVTVFIYAAETTTYKAATKKITVVVKPKIQVIKGIKSQKKSSIYVKYVKDTKASGYEIQTALDSKFKKSVNTYTIKKNSKYSVTLTKKRTGKIYYVRVRSYKIVGSQKIYGSYSGIKKIKVKEFLCHIKKLLCKAMLCGVVFYLLVRVVACVESENV